MNQQLSPETTLGITCGGNIRALCMTLIAVFNAPYIPHKLLLRLEGDMPNTDDFYLAQTLDMVRQNGAEILITVAKSSGIRSARDWLLEECRTRYLWMLDDDVIPSYRCLELLCRSKLPQNPDPLAFAVQGTKTDLNNRRGYANFNNFVRRRSELSEGASPNHHWEKLPEELIKNTKALLPTVAIHTIDTGNVLFDIALLRAHSLKFTDLPLSANSGGEDTLMAVKIYLAGGSVVLNPWAQAIHLEKPNIRFDEYSARAQMVYEAATRMGASTDLLNKVRSQIMSWTWPKDSTGQIAALT